jgi:plastocyanin
VFEPDTLTAKAGAVTIDFDNPASVPHAVEVEGNGVEEVSETVTAGKTSVTADLEPGEYEFYCPVGNHRAEGMEGTLTVE